MNIYRTRHSLTLSLTWPMNSGLSPLATVLYESLLSNHDGISMPTWMSTCFLFDLASIPLMSFLKWLQTPTRKIKRRLKNAQQWSNRRLETLTILKKDLTVQLLHVKGSEHIPFSLEGKVGYPNPRKKILGTKTVLSVSASPFSTEQVKLPSSYKNNNNKKVAASYSLPWISEACQNNVK